MATHTIEGNVTHFDVEIDSLPYVDREIDEENMKSEVEKMIEQEMRRMKKKKAGPAHLPIAIQLFESNELLKKELERVGKKESLDALDTTRYELKGPEDENDAEGWKNAVNNTKAQLESQAGSMFNLELLQKYGANAWRVHNYQLESDLAIIKKNTDQLRSQILEINRERKNDQTQAAASLAKLNNKWSDLISQNLQAEIACAALENEVEELRIYKQQIGK